MASQLHKKVPRDLKSNLGYRLKINQRAATDIGFREAMLAACNEDVLFFFNAFCWLFEPRIRKSANGKVLPNKIPFITWEHQEAPIITIDENLGLRDIGVEKSRGEGMSWILVQFAIRDWILRPMSTIGLVSKDLDTVDNPRDPNSLFWKIDWGIAQLPSWMRPAKNQMERNLSQHTLNNKLNLSVISAFAATGDVASGGRTRWFGMDEVAKFPKGADYEAMASTQHVTDSRLFVSTPKGDTGAYFDLMHSDKRNLVKIRVDWRQNPTKNRGLYRFVDGLPKAIDPSNPLPKNYDPPDQETLSLFSSLRKNGFRLEGVVRSPWYDLECDRGGATPQNIAQELDMDYGGSKHKYFTAEFFQKAEATLKDRPFVKGDFVYDKETLEGEFVENENGPMTLYYPLSNGKTGKPPQDFYAMGVDIGSGLGGSHTSNSVIQCIAYGSRAQVFEYAINTMPPEDFADLSVALAKFYRNAYLAFEANGPGGQAYAKRVTFWKYWNVYRRTVQEMASRKKEKKLGWWTNERTKSIMLGELSRSVRAGDVKIHSKDLLTECHQYTWVNGKPEHSAAMVTQDDSAKGQAHGDRVIAFAVAIQAVLDRNYSQEKSEPAADIVAASRANTFAGRQHDYFESLQKDDGDGWDSRTNAELAFGSSQF